MLRDRFERLRECTKQIEPCACLARPRRGINLAKGGKGALDTFSEGFEYFFHLLSRPVQLLVNLGWTNKWLRVGRSLRRKPTMSMLEHGTPQLRLKCRHDDGGSQGDAAQAFWQPRGRSSTTTGDGAISTAMGSGGSEGQPRRRWGPDTATRAALNVKNHMIDSVRAKPYFSS